MDGAYTDPAVRQAISESISQAEADRMRGDKIREELYGVKYATPTPSITVGTQVRLTGVVSEVDSAATARHIGVKFGNSEDEPLLWFSAGEVEVIRQPFKRGEVVWSCGAVATGEQYVVFNDETNGRVDVVHCLTGTATTDNDISRFERRP